MEKHEGSADTAGSKHHSASGPPLNDHSTFGPFCRVLINSRLNINLTDYVVLRHTVICVYFILHTVSVYPTVRTA